MSDTRLPSIDPSLIPRVRAMGKTDDQFVSLVDTLIDRNPLLSRDEPTGSDAQRAIAAVATLDMQVQNGGLLQFFWNCPQLVEHVSHGLRLVGANELAGHFDTAVEQLAGDIDGFIEHREGQAVDDFIAATEENDFEWFNDLYFGEFDRTTDRWTGLVEPIWQLSVTFMLNNLSMFVRPSGEAR